MSANPNMRHMLKPFLATAVLTLAGAGCALFVPPSDLPTTPPAAVTTGETGNATATLTEGGDPATTPEPYYVAYSEAQAAAALKEGRGIVLYFWAAWCPICKAEEPKLRAWIEASGLPIAGFRVNYDTETALKAKYKIPYQHTTVFLNARGEEVERFSGPVDEATFLSALKKAAGE